jgi:AcrR family transcriptional regulator
MTDILPPRPPKQLRSQRTLERFVRASLQLLDEKGPDGLTVSAIVAGAGSSVGSFYARFEGKEELLAYLGERVWREAAERWDTIMAGRELAGLPLAEVVEGAVRLLGEGAEIRATYLRALGRWQGAGDEAYSAFQSHVLEGVEGLLLACRAEMVHPDPEVAVQLGLRAVMAILENPGGGGSREPVPAERRIREAVTLLLAYLAGGRPGQAPSGQVDFFDIWG